MQTNIRFATADDASAIYELLLAMHEENGLYSLSCDKVKGKIRDVIDHGVAIVATEDEKIVGSVGLIPCQLWYTNDWNLSDVWVFVHPDHRRSLHAKNLLLAIKQTAARLKIPIMTGVVSRKQTEGKVRLFSRYFEPIGQFFIG